MTAGNQPASEVRELLNKAIASWKRAAPGVCAFWMGRAAVVLAELGDHVETATLLDDAVAMSRLVDDSISAESTLADVSGSWAIAGRVLNALPLLDRSRQLAISLSSPGSRALALAAWYGQLSRTRNAKGMEEERQSVLQEMHKLSGVEYSLLAGEIVKAIAHEPNGKNEVVRVLEEALTRAETDRHFGDSIRRDVAAQYASVARNLAQRDLLQKAAEIGSTLSAAKDRASVYRELAVSSAALGLVSEARTYRDEQERECAALADSWDSDLVACDCAICTALVGLLLQDSTMVDQGLGELGEGEDRQQGLAGILDQLFDLGLLPHDPEGILELASHLDGPGVRNYRLSERVGLLCELGRAAEAETLLAQAQSDVDSISDPIDRGRAYLAMASAVIALSRR